MFIEGSLWFYTVVILVVVARFIIERIKELYKWIKEN